MKNKIIPLSEKMIVTNEMLEYGDIFYEEDVKETLKNIKEELKENLNGDWIANRILTEKKKHENLKWAKIAQSKIKSEIRCVNETIFKKHIGEMK